MPDGECQAATDRGFVLYIWLEHWAPAEEMSSGRRLGQTGISVLGDFFELAIM
jgi:hypothetical protein